MQETATNKDGLHNHEVARRSTILASAQGPPTSLAADLCPGWEGYASAYGANAAAAKAKRTEEDHSVGRYFARSAGAQADQQLKEPRWVAVYEEQLKEHPKDDELWLAYAMEYAGPGSEEGGGFTRAS